ncbi:MAG: hypothetical protein RR854_00010 [Muribaculaceae bacterium]
MNKITERHYDHNLHIWVMVCTDCGNILSSDSELNMMPEFVYCEKCRNIQVYELFEKDGKQFIRRNKYPRFTGEVTFGPQSDIEDINIIDKCDGYELANAMRKASEFLIKRSRPQNRSNEQSAK